MILHIYVLERKIGANIKAHQRPSTMSGGALLFRERTRLPAPHSNIEFATFLNYGLATSNKARVWRKGQRFPKLKQIHMQDHIQQRSNNHVYIILLGLICLGIVANCFFQLSSGELQNWDESRHGVSAYEMVKSGNYIINTFGYETDYWNTKPPLSFWSVALGYKLFGFNPFGLRFFSALFSCLTLFMILNYCYKKISPRTACLTGLILLSPTAFFLRHNARAADPDALFIFFCTAGLLITLAWSRRYAAYKMASFLAGMAFLTKSFHAAPFVLLLLIFFLMDFSLSRQSLKQGAQCLLIALFPVALWGMARFQFDGTAFFERMIFYDLLKRGTETIEGHSGSSLYYLKFVVQYYKYWIGIAALTAGIILVLQIKTRRIFPSTKILLRSNDKIAIKLVLAAVLPLFIYSLAASKLYWYSYPTFPFISILLGVFFDRAYTLMETHRKRLAHIFLLCILVAGLLCEARTLKRIYGHSAKQNIVHAAMMDLGQNPANREAALFLDTDDWSQSDSLAARLYGDFQLMQGGTAAYESAVSVRKAFLLSRTKNAHHGQSPQ